MARIFDQRFPRGGFTFALQKVIRPTAAPPLYWHESFGRADFPLPLQARGAQIGKKAVFWEKSPKNGPGRNGKEAISGKSPQKEGTFRPFCCANGFFWPKKAKKGVENRPPETFGFFKKSQKFSLWHEFLTSGLLERYSEVYTSNTTLGRRRLRLEE